MGKEGGDTEKRDLPVSKKRRLVKIQSVRLERGSPGEQGEKKSMASEKRRPVRLQRRHARSTVTRQVENILSRSKK